MAFTSDWFAKKDNSSHWTKSIKCIPEKFSLEGIRKYLVESTDKTFDKESVRAFKSLKAFKFFQAGYVQRIYTCFVSDLSVCDDKIFMCKSEVLASMERKVYKVYVCLSADGEVLGGSCKCVAGLGAVCSHMAALLFALEDFISQGLNTIPEDSTCTDKLRQWNVPAKRHVEHTTIGNIVIERPQLGKKPKISIPRSDVRNEGDRHTDQSALKELHNKMVDLIPNCGFSKYCYSESTSESAITEEISTTDYIKIHPASINDIKTASLVLLEDLSNCNLRNIEEETRDQSNSKKWHKERYKRITASNFHQVYARRETTDPSRLVGSIVGYNSVSTKGMKFGLKMEQQAKARYMETLCESDLKFENCGLYISQQFPHLGASPDGLLKDNDGNVIKLVEFKNPSSTWNLNMKEAAMKLPCLKLNENNKPMLNIKDKYYTQIQGQMGVCSIPECDFVLCTAKDIFIETVTFDAGFWDKLSSKLDVFYKRYVAPEIVYPTIKNGIHVLPLW